MNTYNNFIKRLFVGFIMSQIQALESGLLGLVSLVWLRWHFFLWLEGANVLIEIPTNIWLYAFEAAEFRTVFENLWAYCHLSTISKATRYSRGMPYWLLVILLECH